MDGEARDRVASAFPTAGRRDRGAGAEGSRPRDKGLFPDVLVVVSLCNQSSEDTGVPLYSLHTLKSRGKCPDRSLIWTVICNNLKIPFKLFKIEHFSS